MTQEEILKGNKLIAKFDEIVENNNGQQYWRGKWISCESLKYHLSWDWLMPVIEKIENLKYIIRIQFLSCEIWKVSYEENRIVDIIGNSKIEAVWLAVVDFIKWYNTNKK